MEPEFLKALVEGMLFASDRPLTLRQIAAKARNVARSRETEAHAGDTPPAEVASGAGNAEDGGAAEQILRRRNELEASIPMEDIRAVLSAIEADAESPGRGVELVRVARGLQFRTKAEISPWLNDPKRPVPTRLSQPALETLAVVAYEQPVNRQRIEEIRGVDCGGVLRTLLERDIIRLVGRSDEPGRPLVYGTTVRFLEVFGLESLKDLPAPADFPELAEEAGAVPAVATADPGDEEDFRGEELADIASLDEAERALLEELDESLAAVKRNEDVLNP